MKFVGRSELKRDTGTEPQTNLICKFFNYIYYYEITKEGKAEYIFSIEVPYMNIVRRNERKSERYICRNIFSLLYVLVHTFLRHNEGEKGSHICSLLRFST